jgi:zinc protease
VYFVELHALPLLDIAVEFAAGSGYDRQGEEGLARLAHVLVKEGSARSSGAELANRLAAAGALITPQFDRDRAGYRVRVLATERERSQALDALGEMLAEPSFGGDALEREKARLVSATREDLTKPAALAERRLFAAMYPAHPYGGEPTPQSLGAIRRELVLEFHRAHYRAAGAVVSLVGDISESQARAIAERITAHLPAGEASTLPAVAGSQAQTVRMPLATEQSHILLGVPAVTRSDPHYFALYLGNYVLGGSGFVSRLYRAVREERGLAYSVHSYLQPYAVPGPFVLGLQTERSQTEQALATARAVLERFVSQGPTDAELRAAKKSIARGFALRTDSNRKILNEVAAIGFYRLPLDWLDRFVDRVHSVTAAQVRSAFTEHVHPSPLSGVIVGAAQ